MIAKHLQNGATICILALTLGFQGGCSVAKGPVENLGVNPINSGALTWYVSGTGTDYGDGTTSSTAFRSIQKAINTAICGDLIYVMNGNYSAAGSYSIMDVKNNCNAAAPLRIRAYPGATPTLLNTGNSTTTANWDMVYIEPTAAYIEISGLTIIGNNAYVTLATAQQYQSSPGGHPELNGNCIGIVGSGTATTAPNHISILNNSVSMCPGAGIASKSADYVTVSGNTVFNNSWYSSYGTSGISILASYDTNPSDTATKYKIMVSGNTVYGNQEYVPYVSVGTITDGEGIILDSNNNSAYSGGNITYAPYTGRMLVANNVFYSNGSSGIEVFQTSHADVVNNSTYGDLITPILATRGELFLNYATDVNNYNNIYVSSAGQSPVYANKCTTCTLDYNIYFGGTNNLSTGPSVGAHDLIIDPLYVSKTVATPTSVSLKVQSGSPALASGTSTLAPATDILGNPRPNTGGKYDRGAYQQ